MSLTAAHKKALIEKMYDKVKQLSDLDTTETESLSLTTTPRDDQPLNDTPTKPTPPPTVVRTLRDEQTGPPAPPPKVVREVRSGSGNSANVPQPVVRSINSADSPLNTNSGTAENNPVVGRDRSSTMANGLLLGNARATFRNSMESDDGAPSSTSSSSTKSDENNNA